MNKAEARYLALRKEAAQIVSSVDGTIPGSMAYELERLENLIGLKRAEELTGQ